MNEKGSSFKNFLVSRPIWKSIKASKICSLMISVTIHNTEQSLLALL